MRPQSVVAFAVAALFAVAVPATAQTPPGAKPPAPAPPPAQAPAAAQASGGGGGWSVSFDVGLDSSLKGAIYDRGNGTLSAMPVQLSAKNYRRAYGPGLAWGVAIGRGLSDSTELRIRVGGSNASADRQQTGRVGTENETGTLFSQVDKLMEIRVDAGLRVYFGGGSVQPYIGGQVGVARVSAIAVAFDVPDAIFVLQENLNLYADSTALTAGVSGGFLFNRSESVGIYINVDAQFRGKLKADDGELAGTGFEPINNSGTRWNTPISAGLRLRF